MLGQLKTLQLLEPLLPIKVLRSYRKRYLTETLFLIVTCITLLVEQGYTFEKLTDPISEIAMSDAKNYNNITILPHYRISFLRDPNV